MGVTHKEGIKVYVPLAEAAQLRELASAADRPVTYIIRQAITEFLTKTSGSAASPPR